MNFYNISKYLKRWKKTLFAFYYRRGSFKRYTAQTLNQFTSYLSQEYAPISILLEVSFEEWILKRTTNFPYTILTLAKRKLASRIYGEFKKLRTAFIQTTYLKINKIQISTKASYFETLIKIIFRLQNHIKYTKRVSTLTIRDASATFPRRRKVSLECRIFRPQEFSDPFSPNETLAFIIDLFANRISL